MATWRATVLTIFPEMFPGPLGSSLAGKALADGTWALAVTDIRDFATDKHRSVDDTPAGGGAGMVMRADIAAAAIDAARARMPAEAPAIYLSPRGTPLTQAPRRVSSRQVLAPSCSAAASRASISACSRRARSRRSRSATMCSLAASSRPWC